MPGPTGESNVLSYRGRGVFVCISPWNFPLAIFLGQVAAALAKLGQRERIVQREAAPGLPFDHGRYELLIEEAPELKAQAEALAARREVEALRRLHPPG